jgi:hypothetical protein
MRKLGAVVVAVATLGIATTASAKTRGYIVDENVVPGQHLIGPGYTLFLNRQGGAYHYGNPDSRTNANGIGTGTISPFSCGEQAWQQVMSCVKETFAPYNVVITDVDPGTAPHIETVVAGYPSEIGQSDQVAGIAMMGCDLSYDNPVQFAFANASCNIDDICWTVAQETAHGFGLDHEIECTDPMTYDTSCGLSKRFKDVTSHCGEYSNQQHSCTCTGASSQNSHQTLLQIFGARNDTAPTVDIASPHDGDTVNAGFAVQINATDDIRVTKVELYIDGALAQTNEVGPPWGFSTPATLSGGSHTISAKAYDTTNHTAMTSTITVNLKPPCTGNSDCSNGQVCDLQSGQCIAGPGQQGGVGSTCTDSSQCASGICAAGPDGMRCVTVCTPGGSDCPDGFDCLAAGGSGACWPRADTVNPPGGSGGCAVGGHASSWAALVGFAAIALLTRRRRSC